MASGSTTSVAAAIIGNGMVMVAKFVAFFFTGSGAMLSEAIHTLADLLNQILLMVGILRSDRSPNELYQYGFKSERYVWALISAVGIFFLGCGVTIYHGIYTLLHPHALESLTWAIGVLVISFVIEAIVLWVAVANVLKEADGRPFFKYLRNDADPAAVAVVLEDSAACLGILIALASLGLSLWTGESYWDAVGSISIGLLLGLIAVWLIWRNGQLLVGASIPPHLANQVRTILEQNPTVEEIVDLKTRILDTETFRIKADIRFDGRELAKKLKPGLAEDYAQIKSFEDFERFTQEFGDELVELLADEVDAIEQRIRKEIPQAQHMDIEAD